MATDLSAATAAQNPDPVEQGVASEPITNSNAAQIPFQDGPVATNEDSFMENNSLDTTSFAIKDAPPDINPAGPTPIDDVAEGIQPVADLIPKDAPNHSHPTPPPDRPLETSEADVDTAITNGDVEAQPPVVPASVPAPVPEGVPQPVQAPEASLVRPREDDADADDERAMKRSRVETDAPVEPEVAEPESVVAQVTEPTTATATGGDEGSELAVQTATSVSAPLVPQAEAGRAHESIEAPVRASADPTQTSEPTHISAPTQAPAHIDPAVSSQPAPSQPVPRTSEMDAKPSIETGSAPATTAPTEGPKYSTAPMTEPQRRALIEKMKNLKKTKHSTFFLKPVDPVALNIPAYPEVIKSPMDLGTLDQKLKSSQHGSVQDFVNDFNLILNNARTFNGDAHPVTQAGMNMKAYFDRMMESVPGPDQVAAPKPAPKRSSEAVRAPQRQARQPAPPAAMPTAKSETFALQADGVPQPRRESNGRPARAIKPPANRDIPYAKPKRKEHMLELRFCEHALDEIRSPRYAQVNSVFLMPVDPVALNIPHYRQIVKHPMDLSTMAQKLKQGQYGKASEFRKDFELMIENCLIFNPQGNVVRDMGIQLKRNFEQIWQGKDKWERANKPESARGTSASGDDESDGDEDDEDDAPEDEKEQTIQALQKQLADMQNLISGMAAGGSAKTAKSHKKKEKSKDSKRKIGSISSAPPRAKASAPAPKKKASKPKQVTYEEKQEISEAVGRMDDAQVGELTRIITENVSKYRDQDDMELEIDDLPTDVQLMLLKYVRKLFGKPKGADARQPMSPPDDGEMEDDDFEPSERAARGAAASKKKKHKPMGKREQQEKIEQLNSKLEMFKQVGTSGSESPTGASSYNNAKAESSGDDESEESEEE